jgi:hypothetical protein
LSEINQGQLNHGSLCFQVLVDAPDMVRVSYSVKRLALTDLVIEIQRIPKKTALVKALEASGETHFPPYKINLSP